MSFPFLSTFSVHLPGVGPLFRERHSANLSGLAVWWGGGTGKLLIMITNTLAFLVAHLMKNSLVMRQIWLRSLGWEDPLEKEMATHSSIWAWRIPWTV